MQGAECRDEEMEENPYEEEQSPAALVNHPQIPLLLPRLRDVYERRVGSGGVRSLEALEPPALCLIALEMARLIAIHVEVRVLVEGRRPVREIETGGTVVGHGSLGLRRRRPAHWRVL